MKTKEFIITVIFTTLSLIAYLIFPFKDVFQQLIITIVFFVFLPILFSKYILKNFNNLINFRIGEYRKGFFYGINSLIFSFLILYIFSHFYGFTDKYAVPSYVIDNFVKFLFYEFLLVLPFIVLYEFYFRGFLMGFLRSKIGYWSILFQYLVFVILIVFSNDLNIIQYLPYLIFAPFAGFISYKSNSLFYSVATQFFLVFIMNVIVIHKLG